MLKLDSHQHFWDLANLQYPWLTPDMTSLYRNFEPADLVPELAKAEVGGSIVVQASHTQAETRWLLGLSRQHDFIKGVVGWADLTVYNLDEQLDQLIEQGKLCGLRHQVHDELEPAWLLQSKVIRGLRLVAQKGLTYDLLLRPAHLKSLPALFAAVPEMRWVIDHLAKPTIKSGQLEPWLADLKRAAAYPNVYCKVSGLITEADPQHWTAADIKPYFEKALEFFGPARLLFGSDWPVCLLAGSYQQVVALATTLTASLTPSEQTAFWLQTAQEVYKLNQTA